MYYSVQVWHTNMFRAGPYKVDRGGELNTFVRAGPYKVDGGELNTFLTMLARDHFVTSAVLSIWQVPRPGLTKNDLGLTILLIS